eukprot:2246600-Amphidinium_carterae.1
MAMSTACGHTRKAREDVALYMHASARAHASVPQKFLSSLLTWDAASMNHALRVSSDCKACRTLIVIPVCKARWALVAMLAMMRAEMLAVRSSVFSLPRRTAAAALAFASSYFAP